MRRQYKKKTRLAPRFFVILAILAIAVVCVVFLAVPAIRDHKNIEAASETDLEPVIDEPVIVPDEIVDLSVLCVGDVMVHKAQWLAAATADGYDFTEPFTYIKSYVEEADLAICNIETTFAGDEPSGYPSFCAPDEMADAVSWAGFDLAVTCNNHTIDKRLKGITRTLDVLRERGLATVGTHYTDEKPYTIMTVKGVKIGIVAATYESPRVNGNRTINGITVPEDCFPYLNTFRSTDYHHTEEEYQEDISRILGEIRACREEGAEIVVAYMHWGQEYGRTPNEAQTRMAKDLAAGGADVIFASHSHVVQPMDILTEEGSTETVGVPVFYSLGNFISNQRTETLTSSYGEETARHTEEEFIGRVSFTYNKTQGRIESVSADAIPLWLDKYTDGGGTHYMLIPLVEGYESNPTLAVSGHGSRAENALAYMQEVLQVRAGDTFVKQYN